MFDNDGYLKNLPDWNEEIAIKIAKNEQLELGPDHWQVIYFLREFYQEYKTTPAIRVLLKALKAKFGNEKYSSLYLQTLFPEGAAKQACKLAGLPKPTRCT